MCTSLSSLKEIQDENMINKINPGLHLPRENGEAKNSNENTFYSITVKICKLRFFFNKNCRHHGKCINLLCQASLYFNSELCREKDLIAFTICLFDGCTKLDIVVL